MMGLLTSIAGILNGIIGLFAGRQKAAETAERQASDALLREHENTKKAVNARRTARREHRNGVHPDDPYRRD